MASTAKRLSQKSADKKVELAMHAISSLAELGFARINLRDVALRSGVSLGVIHYYFENKTELLICSVTAYKEQFIADLKDVIAGAASPRALLLAFSDFLAETVEKQAHIHRLWYDVRAQAQFDEAFQPVVADFETRLAGIFNAFVARLHELGIDCIGIDPLRLYIVLDGWFRYYVLAKLQGNAEAADLLRRRALAELAAAVPAAC